MEELKDICKEYDIFLIEDCAEVLAPSIAIHMLVTLDILQPIASLEIKQLLLVKAEWLRQMMKLCLKEPFILKDRACAVP